MTAVAIAPLGRAEVLQWLAPAPLWDATGAHTGAAALARPFIAECTTDSFVEDFTAMLAGRQGTAADLSGMEPEGRVGDTAGGAYRLFPPLSQRYYLVTATLVCRRPGIPDHAIRPAVEERATFVVRRLTATGTEEGFVPTSGDQRDWVPAGAGLVPGEKEHPMHTAAVAPYAAAGTTAAELGLGLDHGTGRTVVFGYVPTGMRDAMVRPMADPMERLDELRADPVEGANWPDPAHAWFVAQVVKPWIDLLPQTSLLAAYLRPEPVDLPASSLFVLVDFLDWLHQHLPEVYDAIVAGTDLTGAYQTLLDRLETVVVASGGNLRDALRAAVPYEALARGTEMDRPAIFNLRPTNSSDLTDLRSFLDLSKTPASNSLTVLVRKALAVNPRPAPLPPELEGVLREPEVPPPGSPPGAGTTYVIRTVFHHHPCLPVVSEPSHPFELARAVDVDAPARKILIPMPDITNLRKYKRGVAVEMPPALAKLMDRVTPDMLKGSGLGPDNGVAVGWICSFSLQIIFLVAFVVMFIFLLALNFCFWWMAFLKICIPIPVPKKKGTP